VSPAPQVASPADLELARAKAEAEVERRKRAGLWTAGAAAHVAFQKRPLAWIVEYLGVPEATLRWSLNEGYATHEWDGDRDPLVRAMEAIADWQDCGVESATGTGKTFLAACLVFWFLACFEDALVITSAPKADQLLKQVWKEIGLLWPRFKRHFPQAELLTGQIRMRPADGDKETWSAIAFVAGVGADEDAAQKAAGFHRPHMLIITEDTPGVQAPIMEAFQHTRTDDHNLHLALGNPDHRNDTLHRFCFDEKGEPHAGVVHVRISALDHPNIVAEATIVPGAIGKRRLEQRTERYGVGSRLYQSRIRGISPAEAEDALIKWEWCVAAAKRYDDPAYRIGENALGVDVAASENGDKGAIARWKGACCTEVEAFACPDPNALGRRVVMEARDTEDPVDPRYVGIDDVGVGAGTVNECRRLGMKVRYLSGGTRAIPGLDTDVLWSTVESDMEGHLKAAGPVVVEAERFDMLRSQVWWRMREDLRQGRVALPEDEELWQDLTTPTYTTRNGRICVEPKETIIKRLRRSPNKGDSCCYGNFVRARAWVPRRKSQEEAVSQPSRNRDTGLERRLAEHAKRAKAEERSIRRRFGQRGRV
jgi:phage terminase large subunit